MNAIMMQIRSSVAGCFGRSRPVEEIVRRDSLDGIGMRLGQIIPKEYDIRSSDINLWMRLAEDYEIRVVLRDEGSEMRIRVRQATGGSYVLRVTMSNQRQSTAG